MFHWINIPLLLTFVQTVVRVESTYITEACVHTSYTNRSVQLNCSGGYISNVTVESGTGRCDKKPSGKCFGKTPTLMVDYMNCYWQHECTINWPRDLIIFTESVGKDCIGREPTFMTVSYKCFNPTDFQEDYGYTKTSESGTQPKTLLIDTCSNLENTRESCYERSGPANTGGIIRSHKLYPWDYSIRPRNCSVKLYWPKEQRLIVTVQNIDVSDDDSLVIVNNGVPVNASSGKTFEFSVGFETSFVFNVGMESNSGKGFLLCFKFVPESDASVKDACREIMGDGSVKIIKDDQDSQLLHPLSSFLQELSPTTSKSVTSTPKPQNTTQTIPARCLKKKPGKKRDRCIKKHMNKKKNPKKRNKGNKKKRNKNRKTKKNKRRRRHGIRNHNTRQSW